MSFNTKSVLEREEESFVVVGGKVNGPRDGRCVVSDTVESLWVWGSYRKGKFYSSPDVYRVDPPFGSSRGRGYEWTVPSGVGRRDSEGSLGSGDTPVELSRPSVPLHRPTHWVLGVIPGDTSVALPGRVW